MHLAAHEGHPEVVRLLLAAGADKEASGGPGKIGSPLIEAAAGASFNERSQEEACETVRLLLEHGVDIRSNGMYEEQPGWSEISRHYPYPRTALSVATMFGHPDVVALLLDYGVGKQPEELLSAMMTATWENGYSHLPALWAVGRQLTPPLHLVHILPHLNLVDTVLLVLLGEHWSIDVAEPLDAAVLNEADPDTGETPLLWLIRNISEEGEWRKSAYPYYETLSPCYETVSLLLKHGADPNIRDHRGQSALDVAREQDLPNCVALLQQYGANSGGDIS